MQIQSTCAITNELNASTGTKTIANATLPNTNLSIRFKLQTQRAVECHKGTWNDELLDIKNETNSEVRNLNVRGRTL